MEYLFLLSVTVIFAVFISFFWFVIKAPDTGKVYGIQPSFSATYKILQVATPKAAHSIWLGLFFLLAIAIIATGQSAWYFGSAVGLMGVGAFPEYWEKDEIKKHVGAAYLAYLVPIIYMLFFDGSWVATVLAAMWLVFSGLCSTKLIKIKYPTTTYELLGFILIIVRLCFN
jgi:hypothetical protein